MQSPAQAKKSMTTYSIEQEERFLSVPVESSECWILHQRENLMGFDLLCDLY